MKYLRNEPLKKHTSFRIGGPADYFCVARDAEELRQALAFARDKKLPISIIGAGTNFLVLDRGFRGLVIKIAGGSQWVKIKANRAHVGAGVMLQRLIGSLARKGLGGMEFLAGIPGSVGGAVVMNAGAWGKEIAGCVEQIKVINLKGEEKTFRKLGFAYRKSRLQGSSWIVTEVVLKLRRKKRGAINKKIKEYLVKRRASQPLGIPNCGSIFKNPGNDFAGRLIERAGCKGMRVGDAQVSAKHANFIVNLGEAKAKDVIKLMTCVQKEVKNRFRIELEPEVKIMVKSPA